YAYSPIGDITDYPGEFYLKNIRSSFETKKEMPWGKSIPENVFRHFVLPIRVNNENIDESRMVFYEELKDRVRGLSLYDAVLEVNHWCHEKVIYTPSDARTSSPLASVKTAYGRCGEESVLTVAALRSVGIPARQVYTPRWAHTDDNHAWVEAWVDGTWYFTGACEPEPVLNLAWFSDPASRGMLMHTNAFGHYNGPEERVLQTDCSTEINVTDNYAPTAKATIAVVDKEGKPVNEADVEFKIYNYAEFYTVTRKITDADGKCFLTAGKGDMLVWATKDGVFGFGKVSFGANDNVKIVLDKKPGDPISVSPDIIPPVGKADAIAVTEEQKKENAEKLNRENEIRNSYVSTFYTEEKANALAKALNLDAAQTVKIMVGSRGNWKTLETFLNNAKEEDRTTAIALLKVLNPKDLRDVSGEVLSDCLENAPKDKSEIFNKYVLNPRVGREMLSPYKSFFRNVIDQELAARIKEYPQNLVEWVKKNITVNDALNPQRIPIMPTGVWKARTAEKNSRNIFFVSVARALNIPARIEPVTRKIQYYDKAQWIDVDFEAAAQTITPQGWLSASYNPIKALDNPQYEGHFTIAKILPNGKLQTLNFSVNNNIDMGPGNTWSALLKKPLPIDEGYYLLITGNRMAKGNVLATIHSFEVKAGQSTRIDLVIRESMEDIQVIGSIDAENKYKPVDASEETSILNTTGRGYFIIGILGSRQEPTNHAMRNLATIASDLNKWNRSIVLLFKNEGDWKSFDKSEFGTLPETITYGIDEAGKITDMITEAVNLKDKNKLPIFIIADTFGRVVYVSQGYDTNMGEQLIKIIRKI
ncbi:MAG: transglutaminase-like domain-containing protein, partial [Mediterranea sp.]|nr:transglutaminase-like domain-containing protein [Mediterranea sp.]